jgi:hypothetical protein
MPAPQIDPNTGERIDTPGVQIDPNTGERISAPSLPKNTMSASPSNASSWLGDVENDLMSGGGRTVIGRGIGHLQGRGDQGMSGLSSGVGEGVANEMGSIPLGLTRAAQGVVEHKPLKTIAGGLQAASIPLQMMAGPEVEAIRGAIPNAARAGARLGEVEQAVGRAPISLTKTIPSLEKAQRLSMEGHGAVGAADSLYNRVNTVNPLEYPEAQSRASALGTLVGEDRIKATPTLQRQVKDVSHSLRSDIGNSVAPLGQGQKYADAIKEYRQASQMRDVGKAALKYGVPAALGTGVAGGLAKMKNLIP